MSDSSEREDGSGRRPRDQSRQGSRSRRPPTPGRRPKGALATRPAAPGAADRSASGSWAATISSSSIRKGSGRPSLTIEEGIELWKAGDPESARDALRYALSACHDNIWAHVALGQIALVEFRDPALARGHFGYAFELGHRALPQGFKGRLPRDRPNNRPFYEAIDGLAQSLEALGRHGDSKSLRALGARLASGPT